MKFQKITKMELYFQNYPNRKKKFRIQPLIPENFYPVSIFISGINFSGSKTGKNLYGSKTGKILSGSKTRKKIYGFGMPIKGPSLSLLRAPGDLVPAVSSFPSGKFFFFF